MLSSKQILVVLVCVVTATLIHFSVVSFYPTLEIIATSLLVMIHIVGWYALVLNMISRAVKSEHKRTIEALRSHKIPFKVIPPH